VKRFFARKTACNSGHTHASAAEAKRCNDLHLLQAAGQIVGLRHEPRFTFAIDGREVKMRNGQVMRYTGDFTYIENNRQVVEEVKAKNGFMTRDVPVKLALMAAIYPDIEVRVVT
jgi:hypothetical protein